MPLTAPPAVVQPADHFPAAVQYVLENEGGYSNDPGDHGGPTHYGITHDEASAAGYNVLTLTLAQAKAIYRKNYWIFGGVRDARLAIKLFDMAVNFGITGGVKLAQKVAGVTQDGKWGPQTEAAVNALHTDDALQRLSKAAARYYADICIQDRTQLVFLHGWLDRAIRCPQCEPPPPQGTR